MALLPYENISKIIKLEAAGSAREALRLPGEVLSGHLRAGLGGTCFSLTFLLERVLRSLGFCCYKVMADMNSGRNVHCFVMIHESGRRLMIDPGYALHRVMEIRSGTACRAAFPHATVSIEPRGDGRYDLWTEDASGRKWRYRFLDVPAPDPLFEDHWVASFRRPTLNQICLTRMTPNGHVYLRRAFLKFTSRGAVDKRKIKGRRSSLIEEIFGIESGLADRAERLLDEKRSRNGGIQAPSAG
jgi:arylamine N-acetyltransferase